MTFTFSALTPCWQALLEARLLRDLDVQLAQLLARCGMLMQACSWRWR